MDSIRWALLKNSNRLGFLKRCEKSPKKEESDHLETWIFLYFLLRISVALSILTGLLLVISKNNCIKKDVQWLVCFEKKF